MSSAGVLRRLFDVRRRDFSEISNDNPDTIFTYLGTIRYGHPINLLFAFYRTNSIEIFIPPPKFSSWVLPFYPFPQVYS